MLVIGSVEPHYFAGWTGGRKSVLPGVCGYETIVTNHSHSLSPASLPTALEGNPIHDDMMDAVELIVDEQFYSIQAVLDRGNRILLFVRKTKNDSRGQTAAYTFLGSATYINHEGERPMSITWQLDHPMPAELFDEMKTAAG